MKAPVFDLEPERTTGMGLLLVEGEDRDIDAHVESRLQFDRLNQMMAAVIV